MISSARIVAVLAAFAVGSALAAEKKPTRPRSGGDGVELAPLVNEKARPVEKTAAPKDAAPAENAPRWSLLSGETMGAGQMAIHVAGGFPGLNVTSVWGLGDRFDAGVRLTAHYAMEGNPRMPLLGFKASAVLRAKLFEFSLLTLGAELAPGAFAYQWPLGPYFGFTAPLTLTAGFALLPGLSASVWARAAPMWNVSPRMTLDWTYQFGPAAEYHLSRQLAVTLELGAGALRMVNAPSGYMVYNALLGVAYAM